MLKQLFRWIKKKQAKKLLEKSKQNVNISNTNLDVPLSTTLKDNLTRLTAAFGASSDLVVREIETGTEPSIQAAVIFIDGITGDILVNENVVGPLMAGFGVTGDSKPKIGADPFEIIKKRLLIVGEVTEASSLDQVITSIVNGNCVILIEKTSRSLIASTKGWKQRNIEEPATESLIRGPREGFIEHLRPNTALLRLRIKSSKLRIEEMKIGEITGTTVALAYINNIASPKVVEEVRNRLKRIRTDAILESGYLEEYIEDAPLSPFPQLIRTERPDKAAAGLLEGKIAIFTDGSPFVLLAPAFLTELLTTPEDYYERFFISTFVRLIRYGAFIISLLLPALYVAIVTYHQEMLPSAIVISIANQREGIPFPAFVEAFLLELIIEVMREAALRMPRLIGQSLTIVGALIIGQAAVQAGLFSNIMLVVVALTAIASFTTPVFSVATTLRLLKFVLLFLAASLGIFGIIAGIFALYLHLVSLRSFGFPYLKPLAPLMTSDLKDTAIRVPHWAMRTRPRLTALQDSIRQTAGLKPAPPEQRSKRKLKGRG